MLNTPHLPTLQLAHSIRCDVVRMLAAAGSGHTGGSLGCADILALLYGEVMHLDPTRPRMADRDRFVLSIGHVAPAYYAALAHRGFFDTQALLSLRQLGSPLQGHPSLLHGLPGIDVSSGSLGQGLSVGMGFALAARRLNAPWRTYVLLGDGELQEGQIWEAAMGAAHHHLSNLTAIIDRNGLQIDGPTSETLSLEPLADKWLAFGWSVIECDGHSHPDLRKAIAVAQRSNRPSAIIAHTRMGCGVPEIEGNHLWHGRCPSPQQVSLFIEQLERHHASALAAQAEGEGALRSAHSPSAR